VDALSDSTIHATLDQELLLWLGEEPAAVRRRAVGRSARQAVLDVTRDAEAEAEVQ
jgi:hypothetical protein